MYGENPTQRSVTNLHGIRAHRATVGLRETGDNTKGKSEQRLCDEYTIMLN